MTLAVGLLAVACGALLWLAGFGSERYARDKRPALAVGAAPVVDSDTVAETGG